MSKHVLAVDLKDDPAIIEAYTEHHQRVWPEVLNSLRRAGIVDMEIYRLGRRLVMLVEIQDGLDVRRVFAAHVPSHPRVIEWEALMKSMQEPPPGSPPGEWWVQMQPVFRLERSEPASPRPGASRS